MGMTLIFKYLCRQDILCKLSASYIGFFSFTVCVCVCLCLYMDKLTQVILGGESMPLYTYTLHQCSSTDLYI